MEVGGLLMEAKFVIFPSVNQLCSFFFCQSLQLFQDFMYFFFRSGSYSFIFEAYCSESSFIYEVPVPGLEA